MRLIIVLLSTAILQVSASSYGQSVTLKHKNASLARIFTEIRKQTGYDFFYSDQMISASNKITIDLKNASLKQALEQIFANQPLSFELAEKTVIVTPKQTSLLDRLSNLFNNIQVSGRVLNKDGLPLQGVTIFVKGSNQSVYSNATGYFSLRNVDEQSVVVFRSVGFLTRELNAQADMGNVILEISNSKLDEVMVVAYGTSSKRLATGSISSVSAEDIVKQPISNPILTLAGRTPGLFISQSAGYAGATYSASIRGQTSLGFNASTPLYIVDGIPFGDKPVEQTAGGFGILGFSPLNNISPDEIESISVLKDADATAIYGSRGANGVILITTKKGRPGKTSVNVDVNTGFSTVTNKLEMLGTEQYLDIRRQAFANDNVVPTAANAPDLQTWDQSAYTNYPELLTGRTAHQTKAAFHVSGGDVANQFLFGGNYRRESTVLRASTADEAFQFHSNMQHKSLDNKFTASVSVSYNMDNNAIPNYSLSNQNYALPPNYPLYNPNGTLYFGPGFTSPLAAFNSTSSLKSTNFISSAAFRYHILPGLTLKADLGYNHNNVFASTISPAEAFNPLTNFQQTSNLSNNYVKTLIAEPQITYMKSWGRGKLNALMGGSWQQTQSVQPYFLIGTFANKQLATSLSALTLLAKSSGYTDYKYDSGFARVEYDWDGKYLFSGNVRRDGSSRFGDQEPFGTFGSAALGWIFSKEQLITEQFSFLSFGKLRASYGAIGSDKSLVDYAYLSTYFAGQAYGPVSSLTPSRILNPYLKWEVTKKLDVALELGFFKDRIFISGNYYSNRSSDLLASKPLPAQTGFNQVSGNIPAVVQNKGVEFELSTTNIQTDAVVWRSSFNFTIPRNKLLSFPDLKNSSYANTYVEGKSLNLRTVYHSTGIVNGIPTAQDINGDGQITGGLNGDQIVSGSSDPKFYGGFSNTLSYKGLQLDILFQFTSRTAQRGDLSFFTYPGRASNIPVSMLDIPLKYSATSGSQALNSYFYYAGSDAAIESASFLRLKNVALSYVFPASITRALKLSGMQVYVHGQNLLTFTKYKGLDPETLGTTIPTLKMVVSGIKFTL
ncbi:SusC/RagA family TonB-linked outer membrane protein [Pedobacter sp. GR22-6]|uniref:SusC/RagA family TonB-linked outer membrane protein n=1 Tax=Pedobacter sp. GR22-6 TaxID=3127957 RepID=UPI00307EFE89